MRTSWKCPSIMLLVLFIAALHGSPLCADPVVVDFQNFEGMDILAIGASPGVTPIPEPARLFDQLLPSHGLIFTSGSPYASVIYYERYGCIPGGKGIQGSTPDGLWSFSSLHPIVINFFKPGDTSVPAVTDFVSIQGDYCGNGEEITVQAYDINGSLLTSCPGPDNGTVLAVSSPTKATHEVWLLGHLSMTDEGVVWDNLTFNTPVPVNTPPVGVLTPAPLTIEIGSPFTIKATAADPDGDMLTYQLVKGSEVLASGTIDAPDDGSPIAVADLVVGTNDPRFELGSHMIDLVLDDPVNEPVTTTATVTVQDSTSPEISPASSESILWPPNHELRPITITANASDNGGGVALTATVQSNEPQEDGGDGSTDQDWTTPIIDDQASTIDLSLRAERSDSGSGRVYTITITATDLSGNASVATVEVRVPHDRRNK